MVSNATVFCVRWSLLRSFPFVTYLLFVWCLRRKIQSRSPVLLRVWRQQGTKRGETRNTRAGLGEGGSPGKGELRLRKTHRKYFWLRLFLQFGPARVWVKEQRLLHRLVVFPSPIFSKAGSFPSVHSHRATSGIAAWALKFVVSKTKSVSVKSAVLFSSSIMSYFQSLAVTWVES